MNWGGRRKGVPPLVFRRSWFRCLARIRGLGVPGQAVKSRTDVTCNRLDRSTSTTRIFTWTSGWAKMPHPPAPVTFAGGGGAGAGGGGVPGVVGRPKGRTTGGTSTGGPSTAGGGNRDGL